MVVHKNNIYTTQLVKKTIPFAPNLDLCLNHQSNSISIKRKGKKMRVAESQVWQPCKKKRRTLGEGIFAKVKFARNIETGENVAIKILDKEKVLKHNIIAQVDSYSTCFIFDLDLILHSNLADYAIDILFNFHKLTFPLNLISVLLCTCYIVLFLCPVQIKREISTMKLIRHPNVIRMYEKNTPLGFRTNTIMASRGRLKEDEARKYFQQLINAVDYCHSRGVCHRDLKLCFCNLQPENLLLDANGVLKVSDFGLSALPQQVREDGLLHTTCGTPNYVAPEVINNKGYDGAKADLWSCGVILFVLMAGYLPFEDSNLMALYKKIFKADFSCPPWFSSSAKKLIKRILDPNPLTDLVKRETKFTSKRPMDEFVVNVYVKRITILHTVFFIIFYHFCFTSLGKDCLGFKFFLMGMMYFVSALGTSNFHFFGYCWLKWKDSYMKLLGEKTGCKGHLAVTTEIFEVAPSLCMVELRKSGGDTLEFHEFYNNLSTGLKDIVWKTTGEGKTEEKDGPATGSSSPSRLLVFILFFHCCNFIFSKPLYTYSNQLTSASAGCCDSERTYCVSYLHCCLETNRKLGSGDNQAIKFRLQSPNKRGLAGPNTHRPIPDTEKETQSSRVATLFRFEIISWAKRGRREGSAMREEVISSAGTIDPTPAASSAGASSLAVPTNVGSVDWSGHGQTSKAASQSCVGSQAPWISLSTNAGGSALGSTRTSCRPWERGDLLRRLATFKPMNWFGKPKVVSSLACAQRGWINIDVDKIECETCGAYLHFTSSALWAASEAEDAGVAFSKQLDVGHKVTCPWTGNRCPESLVQFPPTPQSALIAGYKDRCDGLLQFHCLPVIAASAMEHMRVSRGPHVDRLLSQLQNSVAEFESRSESIPELDNAQDGAFCLYSCSQKLISLCGWEPRWLLNVQDCEEHSAQSARNGCSFGPSAAQVHLPQDPGPSKNALAALAKDAGKSKLLVVESRSEFRSPLLDCSLCGATVRILDFLTVPQPARVAPNIDIPDTIKKMGLTRGVSAASGTSGWVAADDPEKEPTEDRDEVGTTDERKLMQTTDVDLNLTMAGGLSFNQLGRTTTFRNMNDADMGRDLMIGQPSGSEVGDRAASYESRGPSSRKRNLEIGASSDDRPQLRTQRADSAEGTVIDRDVDEVTDGRQYSAGPSKRARDSDIFDTYCSPYPRDSSDAGPSHSMGFETYADGNKVALFRQGSNHVIGISSARDSTRASSVIAMDTVCHNADDDSMESVENYPGGVDDIHFPSSSTYGHLDMNDTSELNYSNQAQQSICFQPAAEAAPGEMGISSTNYGEEIFNAETVTAQARDGLSFGISGGSVGMCASHEAEFHGADASVHRTHSVVGDVEPRIEDAEIQGQTGESTPFPGLMDEVVPDEINRENPHGDSQEMLSRSLGRADSGSKVDGSAKTESVESGEKIIQSFRLVPDNSARPSLSCNAYLYSGNETSKKEVKDAEKSSSINNCPYRDPESDYAVANGIGKFYVPYLVDPTHRICIDYTSQGPPKGESNYEEAIEFDPIIHHNQYCPWVNGNVAAAGCSSSGSGSSTSADVVALCGWQLTLDALDALRSLGHIPVQTVQSESAASLYKDDHQTPGKKLLRRHSMNKSHRKH
ncbi:uncharacterized protein LOC111278452 [Durio zibethinus]|uniref:Uncharacterized protein LOC111278452 n=1 Tax=Durio zibethinus TaxID=66656 RepID=A0A6P5WZ48_DURZI|nr:uncharacterized protein LOC111278452 [Durio zibethinus]